MALLLAMYQKMRLIREKNQLALDLTKVSSKLSRVEKNIERTQKRYTSLFTKLESDAKRMQNMATININNMFGFGTTQMGMNPYNYSGLSQASMMMMSQGMAQKQQVLVGDYMIKNAEGIEEINPKYAGLSLLDPQPDNIKSPAAVLVLDSLPEDMLTEFMNGTLNAYIDPTTNKQGLTETGLKKVGISGAFNELELMAFNQLKTNATNYEQQMRKNCSDMQMSSQNNISIWLDAAKAELEDEQDAALEPLNYEQTMLQLEKETKDQRLKRIEEEYNSYKQLCDNEIKNTTPTFGLA